MMKIDPLQIRKESWNDATAYDSYVGRWSRLISADFLQWLQPQMNLNWLEVGCGTGSLTSEIVSRALPQRLLAIDKSDAYLASARSHIISPQVVLSNIDLGELPIEKFDYITSGLVLNFLSAVEAKIECMLRYLKPGGSISAFVWDYAGHYQPMRIFWDAAKELNESAGKFDAGLKYPLCTQSNLTALFEGANLSNIRFTKIERIATFRDFDDYWLPIASAQGSVTDFLNTLGENKKEDLRALLKKRLPIALNGEIKLILSALAIEAMNGAC
jgi:trans-aconitate methyltransferase